MKNIWGCYWSCKWRFVVGVAGERQWIDAKRQQYRLSFLLLCFAFVITLFRIDRETHERFVEERKRHE